MSKIRFVKCFLWGVLLNMTKMTRFFTIILLIGTLFCSPILPVIGSELDDIYKEQQNIDKKIEETEKNIKKTEQQRKTAWLNYNH